MLLPFVVVFNVRPFLLTFFSRGLGIFLSKLPLTVTNNGAMIFGLVFFSAQQLLAVWLRAHQRVFWLSDFACHNDGESLSPRAADATASFGDALVFHL